MGLFRAVGVGVGLAGLFPRFIYENPAHRASMWALTLGFVFATAYLIVGGLIAVLAYLGITRGGLAVNRVLTLGVSAFVLVSLLTASSRRPGDPATAGLRMGIMT